MGALFQDPPPPVLGVTGAMGVMGVKVRISLPGVRMCAPFEGILHLWIGGLVAQPLSWG